MKRRYKIILIIFSILIITLFIHPSKIIYEPKVVGKILGENNKPIPNATVSSIQENETINEEYGYYEHKDHISQTVKTDINGNFELSEKSRIDWFHAPWDLPIVWCRSDLQVRQNGFKTYRTKFGEYEKYNYKCRACKNIEFRPIVILKKKESNLHR